MAEIIKINLKLSNERLSIPETIEVPQFSIVQWNITNFDDSSFRRIRFTRNLIFTLYFSNDSPFDWKRNFIQIYNYPFEPFYANNLRLAEGMAEQKGNYKYGVSIYDANQDEPIFDEDPILKVY